MNFHTSTHCTSGTHCMTCRAQNDQGEQFRLNMMNRFDDISMRDFECPYKRQWGFVGIGDRVEQFLRPVVQTVDRIFGTNIKNCGDCKKRKGTLNNLT